MKKVTFSDTDEVREYNPEDTPADPLPPDPATLGSAQNVALAGAPTKMPVTG
jgi:hypothetical protein